MRKVVFENTREGFEKLLFHTEALMRQHALNKVVLGIEPTPDYRKPLGEYLAGMDHMVLLAGRFCLAHYFTGHSLAIVTIA